MEVTPELLKILARRKKMEEDRELEEKIKRNNVSTRPKTKRKSIGSQVQSICQMFETGEGLNPKQDDDGLNPKQDINGLNQNQEPKTPVATIPSPIFPPPIKLSTEPCNSFLYKCRIQNTTVDVPDEYYDIPKTPVPCIVEPRINGSFNSVFRDLDRSSTMSSKQSSNSSSTTSSAKGSFLWNHINKNNNKDRISQLSDSSGIVDCLSISSADDVNNNANNNETEALYESIERLNIYESCDDVRAKEGEDVYECVSDKESDEFGTCVDPSGTVEVSAVNNGWFNKAIEETATSNSDKYSRTLKERVMELLNTEILFVEKLRHVVRDYMIQLDQPEAPKHIAELKGDIFSNIDKLYRFHSRDFLPTLRAAQDDLKRLGRTFIQFEEKFELYLDYARNSTKANRIFVLNRDYFNEMQLKFGDRLDLSSYLLEPIQRLPRYEMFLDQLVKTYSNYEDEMKMSSMSGSCRNSIISWNGSTGSETTTSSEEIATTLDNLQSAKQFINKLLRRVNNTIALENIRDCQIDLSEQGELLRQDEFTVTDKYKNTCQMRCFLFEKLLVLTVIDKKTTVELFLYKDSISMTDLGLTPNATENDLSFCVWHRVRTVKPYRLAVNEMSTRVRDVWVNQISDLLRIQAQIIKDKLLEEMRQKKIVRTPIPIVQEPEQPADIGKESNPRDSIWSISSSESAESKQEQPGDKCTSKRKKRKKKVSAVSDSFNFMGQNLNLLFSAFK